MGARGNGGGWDGGDVRRGGSGEAKDDARAIVLALPVIGEFADLVNCHRNSRNSRAW